MRRLVVVLSVGCGRTGFDAVPVTDVAPADVAPDVTGVTACTSGQRIAPVAAINTSPIDTADACAVDSALLRDGLTAGLDRSVTTTSCSGAWDPNGSCGCLAVDLGASYMIATASVWAAPVTQACAAACVGVGCGTGHSFAVFAAEDLATPTLLAHPSSDATALVQLDVPVMSAVRYLMVCREAWGVERDDFAIDYVDAQCL